MATHFKIKYVLLKKYLPVYFSFSLGTIEIEKGWQKSKKRKNYFDSLKTFLAFRLLFSKEFFCRAYLGFSCFAKA